MPTNFKQEISASNNIKSCETRCFNWEGEALIEIRTVTSKNEEQIRTFLRIQEESVFFHITTLLEKSWRISLYVTDDAIASLYVA